MRALTARQRQVLALVAAGLTNDQVGRRLNTTGTTINRHLYEIYRRLDANDRAHAVALAIHRGDITPGQLAAIADANQTEEAVA